MNITHKGIVTLLRAGLTGEKLSLPDGVSMKEIVDIAGKQGTALLIYQGAVNCGMDQKDPLMQRLFMNYYRHLMHHERQMRAVREMFAAFEENGIAYMPLKGCILKDLYPKPELRAMGDADILIRGEEQEKIHRVMQSLGHTVAGENERVTTWKSRDLSVELHRFLAPKTDEDHYAYYGSGWQFARKQTGYRWDMSAEDAYVFIFAHLSRHYRGGGIGCRHVVDLFVYHRAFPEMDAAYINGELEKLHLRRFHDNMMKMLDVWFADGEPDDVTELLTAFICSGGSWGTMEAAMYANEVKAAARAGRVAHSGFRAAMRAVFPSSDQLGLRYRAARKYPALLPVLWVVRWIDIIFFRPQKIRSRVRILRQIDNDKVLDRRNALEAVGLGYHWDE